jgi:hypothetical protein
MPMPYALFAMLLALFAMTATCDDSEPQDEVELAEIGFETAGELPVDLYTETPDR